MEYKQNMATDIQDAFDKSVAELGFESLLDDVLGSPETVEEEEQSEEHEADDSDDVLGETVDDSDDDETNDEDAPLIEVPEGAKLKLPDGTEVDVSQAVLLQADYTRKTQELSEQRKQLEGQWHQVQQAGQQYQQSYAQMQEWYEARASRPAEWLAEIASQSSDPTATVAQALYTMAQGGLLDPKFVETFGIDSGDIAQTAKSSHVESELEELKRWRYEQEIGVQRQVQVKERAAAYENEWEQIKTSASMRFESRADELNAKRELLQFALENNLTRSLRDAHDLMTVRRPKPASAKPQPDAEVAAKKRASRAVTPKSAGTPKPTKKAMSDKDAIAAAMEELGF